jgi:hypothetical protein
MLKIVIHLDGISPIFNQPRLLLAFHDARMEQKARKVKEEEDIIQENKEQLIEEDEHFPRATHLARKLVDKDPGLDFMDPDRREKLIELYSQDPKPCQQKKLNH